MQKLATDYLQAHQTADLFVTAHYGFSQADQTELKNIKGADVEFGKVSDMTIEGTDDAMRVFSNSQSISTYQLERGRFPKETDEIALTSSLRKNIKLAIH